MGAKKPVPTTASPSKPLGSMKARLRPPAKVGRAKVVAKRRRAPAIKVEKSVDKPSASQTKKDDTKETPPPSVKTIVAKATKKSTDAGTSRSTSPKKSPLRQKPADDKTKAIKKVIKSLDIKISGFKTIVSDEQKVECKASISEIVKTKSRAASAKVSPGPMGKTITIRKDDDGTKKVQIGEPIIEESKKQETKDMKPESEELNKGKKSVSPAPKEIASKVVPTKMKDGSKAKPTKSTEVKPQLVKISKEDKTKAEEVKEKPKAVSKLPKKVQKKDETKDKKEESKGKKEEVKDRKEEVKDKKEEVKDKKEELKDKKDEVKTSNKMPEKPVEKKETKKTKDSVKPEKIIAVKKATEELVKACSTNKNRPKAKPKSKEKPDELSKTKVNCPATSISPNLEAKLESKEVKSSVKITAELKKLNEPEEKRKESPTLQLSEVLVKEIATKTVVAPSSKSTSPGGKLLSVRERLQKKYVRDKGSTFKSFKANKQVKEVKKTITSEIKKTEEIHLSTSVAVVPKKCSAPAKKQEKDIYDFKTESESEDNIKMNLLNQSTVLSKIQLDKVQGNEKKLVDKVSQEKSKVSDKDKDFSDEDDQPLQMTKQLLEDAKDQDEKPLSQCMELKVLPVKIKDEVKVEPKKSAAKASVKAATKAKPVKKPPPKRKEPVESSNSYDSASEDSDDASSESCHDFGPKRHRMASLNALAKVQCLYENESRTAHELGLSKSSQIPKIRIIASGSSSDEEENAAKKLKIEEAKDGTFEKQPDSPPEEANTRELRNAPGQRGMGKHWDFNDGSSFESGHESDITFRRYQDDKAKTKKRKIVKAKAVPKTKEPADSKSKKTPIAKTPKKKPRPPAPKQSSDSSDDDSKNTDATYPIDFTPNKKRKRDEIIPDVKSSVQLTSKRMASLNCSAIVAATYEVERHLDRNLDSDCSSFESFPEEIKVEPTKKLKDVIKPDPAEEANKESNRPTSSSVVIVQDTDVTITGVYVNATTGSSQEAYCKMQYRVQSSVTEERVLRPSSIDPPKSYTPLGALSSMRPPGAAGTTGAVPIDGLSPPLQQQTFQPTILNHDQPVPMQQPNAHIFPPILPPHHHHHSQPPNQDQMHHLHHQQPSPKYHHMHHHHHQQPPLAQPRCESPLRYPPGVYQNVQPPMPPPPNSISISGGGSSAFCAPMQQSHHDLSGYYQPAGPLISPHVLPPVPPSNAALVSSKQLPSPIGSEPDQLQQPPQSTSTAESSDSEVLITGGDLATFRYPTQQQQSQSLSTLASTQQQQQQHQQHQQQQQQQQQQNSPYSRSIHPMHYTTAYPPSYYPTYPGDAMCYSPPYQPYFPAKVYQSAPAYRRYPSYYQPGPPPPSELYDPQPPQSNAQQPPPPQPGSQLVPTGPSGPQHLDHYPGPPGFYSGYSPGGGQCYSRGMQPPYMEYPAPCPCPMQSCPKNVHTGPLIGSNNSGSSSSTINNNNTNNSSNSASNITTSNLNNNSNNITANNSSIINNNSSSSLNHLGQQLKTNKGPVKIHSHLMGQHEPPPPPLPQSNLTNGQSILSKPHHLHHHHHQCKIEMIEPLKSEIKTDLIGETIISTENRKTGQYEETVVPPTPPSTYTINDKLIEPEATLSPARGSTGLPTIHPDQTDNTAAQGLVPLQGSTTLLQTSNSLNAMQPVDSETNGAIVAPTIGRKARIGKTMAREMMYGAHAMHHLHNPHSQVFNSHQHLHHQHLPSHNSPQDAIKATLPEPSIISLAIKPDLNRIKKEEIKMEEEDDVVILEEEIKQVKSEPEVLEVLDKSSDLEVIDCTDLDDEDAMRQPSSKRMKILDNKSQCKKSPSNGYKSFIKQTEPKPYLCLSRKSDRKNHFRKYSRLGSKNVFRKRKLNLTDQQKKRLSIRKRNLIKLEKKRQAECLAKSSAKATSSQIVEQRICEELSSKPNSSPDCINDSRGYFSEPDIRSSSSRKAKKTRSTEVRSKSETKKSQNITEKKSERTNQTPKLPENSTNTSGTETMPKTSRKTSKSSKTKSKSQQFQQSAFEEVAIVTSHDDDDDADVQFTSEPSTSSKSTSTSTTTTTTNNNNDFFEHNNNNNKTIDFPNATTSTTCRVTSSWNGKRSRARGSRFGNKKRPKYRHYQTEVDDSIIPRKSNAVPKWNNGWSWIGEPFQGKVFLNSDDPLVIRTCYPAMQHSEGDVIRPRDCVLLRAGSKKNELPYVAKVAHLWENPEDGEMMMSLLWYYRPEHTEQGRQHNDSSDEVFASRHRDHNSVACIEDKCYVLTFSEYCRYRRRVRAAEEGIEDNFLVPLLKTFSNIPKVPVTTNPEQVMFCQRVYEFRLKRLTKTSAS